MTSHNPTKTNNNLNPPETSAPHDSASKFTPGPWGLYKFRHAGYNLIDILGKGNGENSRVASIHIVNNMEANAHLIAAAPELHKALSEVQDIYKKRRMLPDSLLRKIDEVLANNRG